MMKLAAFFFQSPIVRKNCRDFSTLPPTTTNDRKTRTVGWAEQWYIVEEPAEDHKGSREIK
jgi:hypothetical protein